MPIFCNAPRLKPGAIQPLARLRGLLEFQAAEAAFVCLAAPLRVPDFGEGIA